MPAPLLRLRSDEQLVALFRAGHDEAFRAIHDRYHKRLFAYTRQMLPGRQDAEDALQDVFVRAYAGLRASHQQLALRAWLFRVAHNRCIDELRRPAPPSPEVLELVRSNVHDPLAQVDLRESLRRLIEDIRRLPEQQRSALLMRELAGMTYADLAASLGISVGAVKSLLVRARVALAQAAEARDTSCVHIREQLVEAHDRGLRPNANTRKHMRDCVGCKSFRRELRGMSRQLAAISPAVGPLGILAKLGFSSGAKGGAAGGGGIALLGGGGATAGAGGIAVGINHVAALLVAAAATAGGAAAIQHGIIAPSHHPAHARVAARNHRQALDVDSPATGIQAIAGAVEATVSTAPKLAATVDTSATTAAPAKLRDPLGGGPVDAPATGAASVTATSKPKPSSTSSGADGVDDTSRSSSTSSSAVCSSPASPGGTATGTAADVTSTSTGTASSPPASTGTPASQPYCTPSLAPNTGTVSPTTTSSASTSETTSGTSSSGTSSSGASSGSAAPSGSSSGSSTSSTGSGGGSASAAK